MSEETGRRFGHVGLPVTDMAGMIAFYARILGFAVTDRGKLGTAELTFLSRKPRERHRIVLVEGRPKGLSDRVIDQISFASRAWRSCCASIDGCATRKCRNCGRSPLAMPGRSISATPTATDSRFSPTPITDWCVTQPVAEPIDLDRPEAEIRRETEVFCRDRAGFRPIPAWQAEIACKVAVSPNA